MKRFVLLETTVNDREISHEIIGVYKELLDAQADMVGKVNDIDSDKDLKVIIMRGFANIEFKKNAYIHYNIMPSEFE